MKITKYLDYIIYWAIVLIPFSIAIAPAFPHAFIGIMTFCYLLKKIITRQPLVKTPLNLPFFLMFLAAILSFRNTIAIGNSFHGLAKMALNFFTFIVCAECIKDRKHVIKILFSVFFGALLISLDALWQLKFGKDFIQGNALQDAIGLIRATASFPNPNVLGVYLSAISPLVVGLSLFYFKGKARWFGIAASILVSLGIFVTLSRGCGLGFYFALLFISIAMKSRKLTAFLIILLLIFPFVMPNRIREWAKEVQYNPVVFLLNADRLSLYNNTFNMIRHHPVAGLGVNTYSINYLSYKLPEAPGAETAPSMYSHNNFLQLTAETGFIGLFGFLWFLFALFRQARRVYKGLSDSLYKIVSVSIVGCIISFLINGMTETSMYYSRVAMIFWFIIGFSLSLKKFSDAR